MNQIASALQYAHNAKLIHRDVKPENMLVGDNNQIILSDFGIAVVAHSTSSLKTENTFGTVHYMSPEQIQGKPRPASDQYALGIVVYEWLCGSRPFSGSSHIEIAMQHISTPPPSLREKAPEISYDIEQVVLQALAKNPQHRFSCVQDFATALEQINQPRKHHLGIPSQQTLPRKPLSQPQVSHRTKQFTPSTQGRQEAHQKDRVSKRPSPLAAQPPQTQRNAVGSLHQEWESIKPHHQQRVLSILLLMMALFLFAVLTVFPNVPLFSALHGAFIALFGWSAYLLALGLIAFAIAHLVESIQNKKLIRWSFVVGLVALWLILLAESQFLLKGPTGGVLASLLVRPLLGWPEAVGHILLVGLFSFVTIVTFQITLGHVLQLGRAFGSIISLDRKRSPAGNAPSAPSPYGGQHPRFYRDDSRLQGRVSPDVDTDRAEDDKDLIDFEADFGDEDNPL